MGNDDRDIEVIPQNTEKYISFSKKIEGGFKIRFLDSFRFMPTSLEKLAKNLHPDEFFNIRQNFNSDQIPLLIRKGIFPYDYIDSFDKLKETCLPSKECFYNRLNEEDISQTDYCHARNVWNTFHLKTLGEYSDLYIKTDVLLLTDIFMNFRKVCMKTYHLDPAWYFTSPGLSWDAMLKITGVEIELFKDYEMLMFVEKGIRGGISQCSHRYGRANNKYMPDFDPSKPSEFLFYVDANNLYGWAMSQPLPLKSFEWVDPSSFDVTQISDDNQHGYILECDLEYTKELHDRHSDLPLAPETSVPPGCKEKRLLTTLYDKKFYVSHYRNIKQCLKLGLKLTKIHRLLKFEQTAWLKTYIDLNTYHRSLATNDFDKDFFKLMNNSIFGKTMENIRRRVDIRLCNNGLKAEKLIAKPNFQDRTIFAENLAAFHMRKTNLIFNKPMSVGMSIMELSKTLMYSFHYDQMKSRYEDDIKLLYMDTDSFIYRIQTDDLFEDIKEHIHLFDTSDFPPDNIYGIPLINKKQLGKMKDECGGKIMTEFVGLRSKMYAFKVGDDLTKKLKGIKKSTVQRKISFEDYKECLFHKKGKNTHMNLIRSISHNLYTVTANKRALSHEDKKRYVLEDGIHSLPYGHYALENDA